jgi:lipopolysaccharide transport system ATP-binding protein
MNITAKTSTPILKDINIKVNSGESVGILGVNGAGKSTLLKIVAGTIQPSLGQVLVDGKVFAILELGLGFNPELTGRQNVYFSAGIMGFSRKKIDELLSQIYQFSELGKYFDEPVRTFSSGMQMRLAFSIVTAERPDVLIIDEALSVGDIYFQHKSFAKIKSFREQGTTLLFVSHDKSAILNLCDRAVLLSDGLVIKDGKPDGVVDYYNALIAEKEKDYKISTVQDNSQSISTRSGNKNATIVSVNLLDKNQEQAITLFPEQTMFVEVVVKYNKDIDDATVGVLIKDRVGNEIYGTNTYHLKKQQNFIKDEIVKYTFKIENYLGPNSYSLSVASHTNDTHSDDNHDWWDKALVFEVLPSNKYFSIGSSFLPSQVTTTKK